MSELNRLLSEIVSPDSKENTLSVAEVKSSKALFVARLSVISLVVLASASGMAWVLSSVADLRAATLSEPLDKAFPIPEIMEINSPTRRIQQHDIAFVDEESLVEIERKPLMHMAYAPGAGGPVPYTQYQMATGAPVTANVSNSMMQVETVELSGPELANLTYKEAQEYAREGDTQRAIEKLYDTVRYDREHISGINQLAALLYGRERVKDAENVLRKGIQQNPNSSSLKLTLARIYQQTNRDEAALNILSAKQDRLDGNKINVVSMRAAIAQKLGHNDIAQASYRWLSIQEPTDGRWWLGLAVAAERKKALEQAVWAYETAIDTGGLSNQSMQFARQRIEFIETKPTKGVVNDG